MSAERLKTAFLSVIFVSICTLSAHADQVVKEFPGGSAEEMLKSTKTPDFIRKSGGSNVKVDASVSCTNRQGQVLLRDDPGYDSCLADKAKNPHVPRQ